MAIVQDFEKDIGHKSEIKEYFNQLASSLESINLEGLNTLVQLVITARSEDRKIFIAGNGGSASTAEHMAADLSNTLTKRVNAISLVSNTPRVLAIANDYGYEHVFSRQLQLVGSARDLLIVFSGSGNSTNLIHAVGTAKEMNISTIGIVGFDGGKLKGIVDYCVHIENNDMQIAEDIHLAINHMMVRVIEKSDRANKVVT